MATNTTTISRTVRTRSGLFLRKKSLAGERALDLPSRRSLPYIFTSIQRLLCYLRRVPPRPASCHLIIPTRPRYIILARSRETITLIRFPHLPHQHLRPPMRSPLLHHPRPLFLGEPHTPIILLQQQHHWFTILTHAAAAGRPTHSRQGRSPIIQI